MDKSINEEFKLLTRVKNRIEETFANMGDIAYEPQKGQYRVPVIDSKGNKKWQPISDIEADAIIMTKIQEWVRDGCFLEDFLDEPIGECAKCGNIRMLDAISRRPGNEPICSTCGSVEAFEDLYNYLR